jgi:hypothetical protein
MNYTLNIRQIALDFASRNKNQSEASNITLIRAEAYFGFLSQSDPRLEQLLGALQEIVAIAASDSKDPHVDMARIAQETIRGMEDSFA